MALCKAFGLWLTHAIAETTVSSLYLAQALQLGDGTCQSSVA